MALDTAVSKMGTWLPTLSTKSSIQNQTILATTTAQEVEISGEILRIIVTDGTAFVKTWKTEITATTSDRDYKIIDGMIIDLFISPEYKHLSIISDSTCTVALSTHS